MSGKRILFVGLHRLGRSPSQRFRFEQYLEFLQQNGFACDLSYLLTAEEDQLFYAPGNYTTKARILLKMHAIRRRDVKRVKRGEFDAVYVQREAFSTGTTRYEKAFAASGTPLIYDFDDAIWLPNISPGNKALAFLKRPEKTFDLIRYATRVFAGNDYLADTARAYNSNVVVVPSTVDMQAYQPVPVTKPEGVVTIGWMGSSTTIPHFQVAEGALARIKAAYGPRVAIHVVGSGTYANPALGVDRVIPWSAATEVESLCKFDIGIMPLPNEEWTKGKCGMKGLQYMALGIPTIMAPVGVNTTIIQPGQNGLLAQTEDDWVNALTQLIESPNLRKRLGDAGQETVRLHYSVEAWKAVYLKHFQELTAQNS